MKVQTFLRHEPRLREGDGAAFWQKWMQRMKDLHLNTHDLGMLTGGWKCYHMHQTGLDLNVVLTCMESVNTSEQDKSHLCTGS